MNFANKTCFTAIVCTLVSGCASLSEPQKKGNFAFENGITVSYTGDMGEVRRGGSPTCDLYFTLLNNSGSEKKAFLTVTFIKNGVSYAERTVSFPSASAGGKSVATTSVGGAQYYGSACTEFSMKASLRTY